MKKITFLFIVSFSFAKAQSGWVKVHQELYAQVSVAAMVSEDYYNLLGNRIITNQFQQSALNLYAEYGLSKKLTIIGTTAFRYNAYETTDAVIAPGDLRLELKYSLLQGKFPLAVSVASEIPLSNKTNFATADQPNDLGIREQINLATTDGEVNFWTTLAISRSFGKGKTYASTYSAYNLRTSDFTDQIKTGIEFGVQPAERLWLIGKLSSLFRTSNEPNPGVSFIRGEGTTYTAHSLAASYELKNGLGFLTEYLSFSDFIAERKNMYSASVFSVGIFLKKVR